MGCGVGKGPIPYLGLSVGGRRGGTEGWQMVIEKMRKKFRGWDVSSISLGGRMTLLQLCLSSILLY